MDGWKLEWILTVSISLFYICLLMCYIDAIRPAMFFSHFIIDLNFVIVKLSVN